MKTENEIIHDILEITLKIENKFPEILKYINEMPLAGTPNYRSTVNDAELIAYKHDLNIFYDDYANAHKN